MRAFLLIIFFAFSLSAQEPEWEILKQLGIFQKDCYHHIKAEITFPNHAIDRKGWLYWVGQNLEVRFIEERQTPEGIILVPHPIFTPLHSKLTQEIQKKRIGEFVFEGATYRGLLIGLKIEITSSLKAPPPLYYTNTERAISRPYQPPHQVNYDLKIGSYRYEAISKGQGNRFAALEVRPRMWVAQATPLKLTFFQKCQKFLKLYAIRTPDHP